MTQAALVLARLRSHLGRSLVLVAVIAVASGIALSALAVLRVADDPWAPLVAATNGGDVELDEAPARPDPEALAILPEVKTVGVLIESGDAALQVGGDAVLVSLKRMPDRETMVVDRPLLMAGRWFGSDTEVVFEATMADSLGIEVGDSVTLNGRHGRTARVVGTAATTMLPNYPERLPGSIFAGTTLFDAIDPVGTPRWSIGLRLRDPPRADEVVGRLNASGPVPAGMCTAAGWCARTSADIRDNAFPTRVDTFAQVMLFFAVLMLVAAVLLIVTLLGSRLVSEARELTLLQVAGATPARLASLIAAEHVVLAVAGVAAGSVLARAVAPRVAEAAATVFGSVSPSLSLADVVGVGVVAVAASILVSAVGGLRAGRRSLAVVARGGSGRVRRSRAAAVAGIVLGAFQAEVPDLGERAVDTQGPHCAKLLKGRLHREPWIDQHVVDVDADDLLEALLPVRLDHDLVVGERVGVLRPQTHVAGEDAVAVRVADGLEVVPLVDGHRGEGRQHVVRKGLAALCPLRDLLLHLVRGAAGRLMHHRRVKRVDLVLHEELPVGVLDDAVTVRHHLDLALRRPVAHVVERHDGFTQKVF